LTYRTATEPPWSNLKADPVECACGCGIVAALKAKAWKDGTRCNRGCKCARCRGANNRRSGLKKQNTARKALGIPLGKFGSSNEEKWSDNVFANEVKSGQQCGPLFTWWQKVEKQVRANEADFGDTRRPVRAVAMPAGTSRGLVVVELETWRDVIAPALDEFFGSDT
jgi:hypothetical protein